MRNKVEPIKFNEANTVYGKGQENLYEALPALLFEDGEVVTCWKLSFKDILRLIFTRKLWLLWPHSTIHYILYSCQLTKEIFLLVQQQKIKELWQNNNKKLRV